jgi:hypothetical protein
MALTVVNINPALQQLEEDINLWLSELIPYAEKTDDKRELARLHMELEVMIGIYKTHTKEDSYRQIYRASNFTISI